MTTTTIDPQTTLSHVGQTILVGEEIYLRRIEKRDAAHAMSWRDSVYPISPSVAEAWIGETNNQRQWFAVVRKTDDRVVGSCVFYPHRVNTAIQVTIDPLFGDAARHWQAEAIRLVLPWRVDELQVMSVSVTLNGDETEAIAAALACGAQEVARSPKLIRSRVRPNGEWVDLVHLAYLNRTWQERLPVPTLETLVRTGSDEPRPVPKKSSFAGDPPPGAILVGQRVYLKAVDKDDAHEMARMSRIEPGAYPGSFRAINSLANHVYRRLEDNGQRLRRDIGFAVRLRETDQFIGEVAILGVDYVNRYGESASWMYDPAFRSNGYGSEAKHLLLEYSFETLGLRNVGSRVSTDNPRSAAALRKQGYVEAGVIPWVELDHGRMSGDIIFHLAAETWRNLPRE